MSYYDYTSEINHYFISHIQLSSVKPVLREEPAGYWPLRKHRFYELFSGIAGLFYAFVLDKDVTQSFNTPLDLLEVDLQRPRDHYFVDISVPACHLSHILQDFLILLIYSQLFYGDNVLENHHFAGSGKHPFLVYKVIVFVASHGLYLLQNGIDVLVWAKLRQ